MFNRLMQSSLLAFSFVNFATNISTALAFDSEPKFPIHAGCTLELKSEGYLSASKLEELPRTCVHEVVSNKDQLEAFSSLCKLAASASNVQFAFELRKCPESRVAAVCKAEDAPEFVGYYHGASTASKRTEEYWLFEQDCFNSGGTLTRLTP
ncbi:MAG: hypothetical protein RL189_1508 [Pseudomonadota bacterium]